jgi:hypothetical protein
MPRSPSPPMRLFAAAVIAVSFVTAGLWQTQSAARAQSASPPYRFEPLAQVGGSANAVAVDGGIATLGLGPRVVTADVADPAHPRWLGYSAPLPGVVRDLVVVGNQVLAVYRGGMPHSARDGLAVVDVADPGAPRVLSLTPVDLAVQALAVEGRWAYLVGNYRAGDLFSQQPDDVILVIDISDPHRPQQVGRVEISDPFVAFGGLMPIAVTVRGTSLYVVHSVLDSNDTGVRVYDVATPATPALRYTLQLNGEFAAAARSADGGRLYVVTHEYARPAVLHVLGLDGAEMVVELGTLALDMDHAAVCGGGLAVQGDAAQGDAAREDAAQGDVLLYVDRCSRRLHVVDAGDPEAPEAVFVGSNASPGAAVAWSGRYAFVAGATAGGLKVLDLINPTAPGVVAGLPTLGSVTRLVGAAGWLYTAEAETGLVAIDPATLGGDPLAAPRRSAVPGARDLVAVGDRLVVGVTQPPRLDLFDLDVPDQPRRVESHDLTSAPTDMAAAGERLVVRMASRQVAPARWEDGGLAFFNRVGEGLRPYAQIDADLGRIAMSADGGTLYALNFEGFTVVDAADPTQQRKVAPPRGMDLTGQADSFTAGDGVAYVGLTGPGAPFIEGDLLADFDISRGDVAEFRGRVNGIIGTHAGRMLPRAGFLAVAARRQLSIVQTPLTDRPTILAAWPSLGSAADLVWIDGPAPADPLDGARIYLADGDGGLSALALVPSRLPTPQPSPTQAPRPTRTPTSPPTPAPVFQPVSAAFLPFVARWHSPKPAAGRLIFEGQVFGPTRALAARGDRVFRGEGPHLVVLDASDPAALREIGRSAVLGGSITALAISGDVALVGVSESALTVLDITGPTPEVIVRLPLPDRVADIAMDDGQDGLAYLAAGEAGVLVVDLGEPARPRVIGRTGAGRGATMVHYDEGRLYAMLGPDTLALDVIDVRDPERPVVLAQWRVGNSDHLMTVKRHRYFEIQGSRMSVFDVTDAIAPVRMEAWSEAISRVLEQHPDLDAGQLIATDRHLYVIGKTLLVFDISGPAPPTTAAAIDLPAASSVAAMTDRILVTQYPFSARLGHGGPLAITDIKDPARPQYVATMHGPLGVGELYVFGNLVVMAGWSSTGVEDEPTDGEDGLADVEDEPTDRKDGPETVPAGSFAIDVSDPAHPRGLGLVPELANLRVFVSDGPMGFALTESTVDNVAKSRLTAFDMTVPLFPKASGSLDLEPLAQALARSGSWLYLATWRAEDRHGILDVVDASDVTSLRPVASLDLGVGYATGLVVQGDYAYVPRWRDQQTSVLTVVDLTDPRQPRPVDEIVLPVNSLVIDEDQGYAASNGADGVDLRTLDLRTPSAPVLVSTTRICPSMRNLASGSQNLVVATDHRLIISGGNELCIVDVSTPTAPVTITTSGPPPYLRAYEGRFWNLGVAWANGHAFASLNEEGRLLGLASWRLQR